MVPAPLLWLLYMGMLIIGRPQAIAVAHYAEFSQLQVVALTAVFFTSLAVMAIDPGSHLVPRLRRLAAAVQRRIAGLLAAWGLSGRSGRLFACAVGFLECRPTVMPGEKRSFWQRLTLIVLWSGVPGGGWVGLTYLRSSNDRLRLLPAYVAANTGWVHLCNTLPLPIAARIAVIIVFSVLVGLAVSKSRRLGACAQCRKLGGSVWRRIKYSGAS